jgi:anti-sigma regulatory factor (Ser/Thr protein kinase)
MTFSTSDRDEAATTVPASQAATSTSAWLLRYVRSYPGTLDQVRLVRAFLRESLSGCPRADDAVAVGSELAANAAVHSRSGVPGGHFTVRVEVNEGAYVLVTVEDDGGPWQARACEPERGHGLDLVQAIAGPGHWGVTGDANGRQTWARLIWPGAERLERELGPLTTAEQQDSDDGRAELEKLAAELTGRELTAHLVLQAGKLPYLAVNHTKNSGPPQRIYAQADWFFGPYAERIAACDDLTGAADAIVRALLDDGEASRA